MSLYLLFLAIVNLYEPLRIPAEARRFWDLPWFFGLMCLIAATWRRSLFERPAPAMSTQAVPAPTGFSPLPLFPRLEN